MHCCYPPYGPLRSGLSWRMQIGSERCGGRGSPLLLAGAWETISTAKPDTDWVWHCVQEARRSFSFTLFFSISKREPFLNERLTPLLSPLTPPGSVALLALLRSFFHSSLYVPILTPSFFYSQIKTSGLLFLLSFSFIVRRTWLLDAVNLILCITTSKNTFVLCPYKQQ